MNNKDCAISLQDFKVLVRCFTYNQSKYIEDALNGFAMQQTNFPFVCLVMDDASTDGEQDVIKKWMECECDTSNVEFIDFPASVVIIAPHKSNTSCVFAFYMLKHNFYKVEDQKMALVAPWREKCEYEAICEGDDYWIDPLKLQKQVDFLDDNPEYGMCYTQCQYFHQDKHLLLSKPWGGAHESFDQIMKANTIPTLTVLMRLDLLKKYTREVEPSTKDWLMGDYPMWIWFSYNSKIKFLNKTTGIYRVLANSASHSRSAEYRINFALCGIDIQEYFSLKYGKNIINREKMKWRIHLYNYALSREFAKFINIWHVGVIKKPKWIFDVKPYKYLLFFIFPSIRNRYLQA